MKRYIFILFAVFLHAAPAFSQAYNWAEDYSIDSITVDSFYLRTRTITASATDRPDTLITYTLFTDTLDFIAYLDNKLAEITSVTTRAIYIKRERDTLAARYDRLYALGGPADSPFRSLMRPPELQEPSSTPTASEGLWVLYLGNSGEEPRFEYCKNIDAISEYAYILFPEGVYATIEKPKPKKPKATKPKVKKTKAKKQ